MYKVEFTEKQLQLVEQALDVMWQEMMAEADYPKETWAYNNKTRNMHNNVVKKLIAVREQK